MIIGIVGKKQSGKDTVCTIIRYISWLKSSKLWGEVTLNAKHFEAVRESEDIAPILSVWEKHPWAEKLKQCASIMISQALRQRVSRNHLHIFQLVIVKGSL